MEITAFFNFLVLILLKISYAASIVAYPAHFLVFGIISIFKSFPKF